jgi:tetratricopeptide (TPR) repeat protein
MVNRSTLQHPGTGVATTIGQASSLKSSVLLLGSMCAGATLHRARAIREKVLGPDHPDVATSLDNLAVLYRSQGRHALAQPLHKRALAIYERALGPDHPDVAISLNNLASLHADQGHYATAEPLLARSSAILEKALGPNHPDVATSLANLAELRDKARDTARV